MNTFIVSARQSCKPLVSSDCNALQEPCFRQAPQKIAVSPEIDLNNKHWIDEDHNFCLSPNKTCQLMYHGKEETALDMNEEAFLSDSFNHLALR